MRLKLLFLLLALMAVPAWAQTGVRGVVIDSKSLQPVAGATVMLDDQGTSVSTSADGTFVLAAPACSDRVLVLTYGYADWVQPVTITKGQTIDLGTIKVVPSASAAAQQEFGETARELVLTEDQLDDEEGSSQAVATLSSATDNTFYQASSYNWSIMRFRIRGYNSEYTQTAINGISFNDAARGRFNYSMLGGMNWSFKNKAIGMGLGAQSYGFGDIGGMNNINTMAADYAPGLRASVSYTNSNYRWRGQMLYSTGLLPSGWALAVSAVGRYAGEGVIPGSFYNSWGAFLAVEKVLNSSHSLALTVFGAPTKRSSNSATFEEAYKLVGDNLYNVNWGWQAGDKRSARVVESFDPTAIFNWVWKIKDGTTLNTGLAFHKSYYSTSALSWYNSADPRPDYYRYLPSWYDDESVADYYTQLWTQDDSFRQINWSKLYDTNRMNNYMADLTGQEQGSSYMLEKRHSNQATWALASNLSMRWNEHSTLQGGLKASYTRSSYYKTVKDLLGGRYWLDVDQYSERDFPDDPDMAQNDLDNPNRKVTKGDRFGYDYNINQVNAGLWAQNVWNLAQWDLNLSARADYTTFQRDGKMRNGRAPENSLGKGERHTFINWGVKGGATFKIDGRNSFTANAYYGTRAPLSWNAYVSPRIKDDVITDLESERIASGDISYNWSYRLFKGTVTGFYTDMQHGTERTSFYDDLNNTFMNYALTDVHKVFKGVEIGLAWKMTQSVTFSAAANLARYQYKNRPTGTRSFENGSEADVTQTVYLKNFYVGSTPQECYSIAFNYAAPHMWFFEVNGAWMNRSYVDLSPVRHEKIDDLWTVCYTEEQMQIKIEEIAKQEKLNEALVINMSIGKVIYLNRSSSLNINLNLTNLLNNRNIQTGGYQQGRFDYDNYSTGKYPNKYYYAQGFKMYLNVGVRF